MANVIEIAVRRVKPGKENAFRSRRSEFITTLKQQPGVKADREFASFHALPTPDDSDVFIGMTDYDDLETVARIQRRPGVVWRFLRFSRTMDLKAYVFATQTEGPTLDLATLGAGDGHVVEVAVRRITNHADFDSTRERFVDLLSEQDGVLESYELAPVKGKDIEDVKIGMTVYESKEAFEAASSTLVQDPITQEFFTTFQPIAVQYAVSTDNT